MSSGQSHFGWLEDGSTFLHDPAVIPKSEFSTSRGDACHKDSACLFSMLKMAAP
jgi:hypothetical protein